VFPARYELNSYIVFRKRLVSKRLRTGTTYTSTDRENGEFTSEETSVTNQYQNQGKLRGGCILVMLARIQFRGGCILVMLARIQFRTSTKAKYFACNLERVLSWSVTLNGKQSDGK
jgi:hypothetical protein